MTFPTDSTLPRLDSTTGAEKKSWLARQHRRLPELRPILQLELASFDVNDTHCLWRNWMHCTEVGGHRE
ncbi:hypothetical protein BC936DRAFT_141245 [Jimgerdemannia flammicorona]|uniref:Uncharacterized protein n=1 Tax=Jimgerdemannia flammicorona TaxID=994334 RepID=A0A433DG79_9FUNG|nr:hypothetical protein BC936DRAFT_141245 [Jimgerdemannia flammicorona]